MYRVKNGYITQEGTIRINMPTRLYFSGKIVAKCDINKSKLDFIASTTSAEDDEKFH